MKKLLVFSIVIFSFLFYCLPVSSAGTPETEVKAVLEKLILSADPKTIDEFMSYCTREDREIYARAKEAKSKHEGIMLMMWFISASKPEEYDVKVKGKEALLTYKANRQFTLAMIIEDGKWRFSFNPNSISPPTKEPVRPTLPPPISEQKSRSQVQERSLFAIRKFEPDKLVITELSKNKWALVDPKDNRLSIVTAPNKLDAEMAVRTIKFFGLNEALVFKGADIQLLLSSGKAPDAPHPGEYSCDRFDPFDLDIKCDDRRCWLEYIGTTISIFRPNISDVLEKIKDTMIEKEITRRCRAKPPEMAYGSGGSFSYWRSESEQEKANPLDEQCISFNPFKMERVRESYIEKGKEKDKAFFCSGRSSPVPECLNFMKEYKLNQICRARIKYVPGSPTMNYFLISGKAPQGKFNYGECVSFDPDKLAVKASPDLKHSVVSGDQTVFQSRVFYKTSELDHLVKVIRKYEFNTRCDLPTDLGRANGWQVSYFWMKIK